MTSPSRIAAIDGSGARKVLVLHGWALDSGVWLASRWISNTRDFTWAYVDFPAYGVNRAMAPADGVEGMAKFALEAAEELNWTSFAVLGHSMGGVTALRVATLRPGAVTSVVTLTPVSPAGTPLDASTFAAFDGAWADFGVAIKSSLSPRMHADDIRRICDRNRATMDRPTWTAYLKNWSSPSFMADVPKIQAPVTVLYGETDPFVTADYLKPTVDQLANGKLHGIPIAGHYPMIEATAATQRAIESALI